MKTRILAERRVNSSCASAGRASDRKGAFI